ncbi:response regulator [Tunicatimonas pelagia]|uniref:response regulator n=1 Tax=Tunicatimonas pelagia TaxID=931531 RepID=UPI0026654D58|nr:response regulator [Tunicatimonas pelagia]WKN45846.1 response regulator [Tunicatimonas pelagia]
MINLVLLIDDNDTDNFISRRVIELTAFAERVVVKSSGQQALDYLQENAQSPDEIPDLIFLDINMPIMDGFMFLYEFETLPSEIQQKPKVIILSSSEDRRDVDKIITNQAVIKYITKPLTQSDLEVISNEL